MFLSCKTPTDPSVGLGVFFTIMLVLFGLMLGAIVSAKAHFGPAEAKAEVCKCGVACACAD